jgi:hypothetical protein
VRVRALILAVLAVVAAAGCSVSDSDGDTSARGTTTAETATEPQTTTTTDGIDPLERAGTAPVVRRRATSQIALNERVALGRHEGFDRVVFQFRNAVPGYHVEYVRPPLHEDGSGARVRVEGDAFVVVRMEPASGFDVATGEGELVYTGASRIAGAPSGTSVVREVVRTGDFEAVLTWAIGLSDRVDFRVTELRDPARIVVDFRNH